MHECKTSFSTDSDTLISCQIIGSWFVDISACIWVEGKCSYRHAGNHMCFLMASELRWQQEHQCTEPEVIACS